MKILIPNKPVPDPDVPIKVNPQGTGVDRGDEQLILNPFDAIALEEAIRIREASNDEIEIVTVAIGKPDIDKVLRTGLAMGADRAILVVCEPAPDPWNVAKIIRTIVAQEEPGIILMGKQAIDDDCNQVGQFLASLLDWPQATFVSKLELENDGIVVDREIDEGIETFATSLPAVVTVDLRLNEPRYASLPAMMKAKRKTIDITNADALGIVIEPRVEIISITAPSAKRNCLFVDSADEFLAKLREEMAVI
jgi:electron transfer flavoprotein beta subunit